METAISVGIKRKCSSTSQIKSSKRRRFEGPQLNILDLSDCTLLHVLQFLDATSLYELGETCMRFKYLVQDESLWIHVDGRSQPNNADKLAFCWQNVHKKTKHLLLAGSHRCDVVLSLESLIGSDKLTHLTVLALEHQCIKYCKLVQFPNTLQELSFRHSYIAHHGHFFRFAEASMCNLKTLILDHCQWLEAGSLTSFCKFAKLEILSLYMCKKVSEDDIGSISLAGKFGFKSLKVVDLRFSGVGDLFIKTFYANPSVQVIYFQCFATTYYLERYKRKLDILDGAKVREHSYISDDEANNDTSKRSLDKRFEAVRVQQYSTYTIKDDSMIVFNRLKKAEAYKARPKSFLYSYPYDECTCGFFDKTSESYGVMETMKQDPSSDDEIGLSACSKDCCQKVGLPKTNKKYKCDSPSSSESSGDENNWDRKHLRHKLEYEIKKQKHNRSRRRGGNIYFLCPSSTHICRKIVFDSCTMPDWCRALATPRNCIQKWLYAREPRNDYEISMLEHTDKHLQARVNRGCGSQSSDCDCTTTGEGDRTVIIIARNPDGSMINFSTGTVSEGNTRRTLLSDTIKYLIKETSACIQRLKVSRCPDNEAMTVVNEFLNTVDECLKKEEFFKFFDDVDFIRQLCISFYQLSRSIEHDIYYVLYYHYLCFEDLLKQLQRSSSSLVKKNLFKRFFDNLLCSEGRLALLNQQTAEAKAESADENWNLPGPSGLQSALKTCKPSRSRKKKRSVYTDADADSDSSTELTCCSKKVGRRSQPFQNSEERNGVEKSSVRNVLSSYIVNKRKYQLLNVDSDTDEDLENSNVAKYLVYNLPVCEGNLEANNFQPPPPPPPVIIRADEIEIENMVVHVVSAPAERDTPTNIKELSFRGFPHVTDRTLMLLKELDLELLDVTGTNVTRLGVQQFMMYNPQCRLIHETACVCRPKLHF